jgi:hypothetical protein
VSFALPTERSCRVRVGAANAVQTNEATFAITDNHRADARSREAVRDVSRQQRTVLHGIGVAAQESNKELR